jgi:hypothetical protein
MLRAHVALDLVFGRERRDGVDDDDVDFAAPHELSTISSACSPVSGCEMRRSSIFTPSFFAYSGSSACSASMKSADAAFLLRFGDDMEESVVLPELSGPKISMMRPRGKPPMPSAQSTPIEPVGMALTSTFGVSPSFMIDFVAEFGLDLCECALDILPSPIMERGFEPSAAPITPRSSRISMSRAARA